MINWIYQVVLEVFQQFAKVQEKNVILEAPKGNLYSYLWSNGATSRTISVLPPSHLEISLMATIGLDTFTSC